MFSKKEDKTLQFKCNFPKRFRHLPTYSPGGWLVLAGFRDICMRLFARTIWEIFAAFAAFAELGKFREIAEFFRVFFRDFKKFLQFYSALTDNFIFQILHDQ